MNKGNFFKKLALIAFLISGLSIVIKEFFSAVNVVFYPTLVLGNGLFLISVYFRIINNGELGFLEYIGILFYLVAIVISLSGFTYWYYIIICMFLSCLIIYIAYKKHTKLNSNIL